MRPDLKSFGSEVMWRARFSVLWPAIGRKAPTRRYAPAEIGRYRAPAERTQCSRLKSDRIVEDHPKILRWDRSIGSVVCIAETQLAILQGTCGDAVVDSRVDLFFPAMSGHAAIGKGAECSNAGESEPGKVASNSDAIGFLARLIEVGNHQRVEGGIPAEGISDARSTGSIVKFQRE